MEKPLQERYYSLLVIFLLKSKRGLYQNRLHCKGISGKSATMITKRQLGLILAGSGLLALIGVLAIDVLKAGNFEGIGPVQRMALGGAGLIVFVGLSLIPLGNRPA
jgi:hypothetical protein